MLFLFWGKILLCGKSRVSNCGFRADTFCQWRRPGSDGRCLVILPGAMNFFGSNGLRLRPLAEDALGNGPVHALEKVDGPVLSRSYTLGNTMRKQRGFSLIELLIVVAIILLIAAIAIPNLLRAKMAANESSAASAVRSITSAEVAYFNGFPTVGYAVQLPDLGRTEPCVPAPTQACLLDSSLANAIPGSAGHSGYQFLATGINSGSTINSAFVIGGTPVSSSHSGTLDFCAVTDGVMRRQGSLGALPPNTIAGCQAYPVAQ
jgi:type IV pilus assembly protein PilA